jgi:hypothetical protein
MDPLSIGALITAGASIGSGLLTRQAQAEQARLGRQMTGLQEASEMAQGGLQQQQKQSGLALKDYINTLRTQLGA